VHAVDGAALRVDVRERGKCAVGKVRVEVVCSLKPVHGVLLHPFVHVRIDDISLVVVLPGNVLLSQGLKDTLRTSSTSIVGKEPRSLISIINESASRARRSELPVRIGRTRVFSVVRIPETVVLCQESEGAGLFLGLGVDDKGGIAGRLGVLFGLTLDEATHGGEVGVGRLPLLVDFVGDTGEVVVGVLERDFVFVGRCADRDGLTVDGVVGVCVCVAVGCVAQEVVDVLVEATNVVNMP